MKFLRVMTLAALVSLPGTVVQVYGQQEKRDEKQAQPEKQQAQPRQQAQPKEKAQAQPRQQAQPKEKAQAQPRQQAQPKEKAQAEPRQQAQPKAKAQAQPRQQAQPKEKAQAQPRQQEQPKAKAQAQPRQQAQPKEKAQAQPRQQAQPKEKAQAQPRQQAQQSNPGGQKSSYSPPQRTRQQAQTWQQQSGWRQGGGWQGQATFQQDRSSNWGSDHRTWGQRGGYGGYYIPLASFDLHFGAGHWFRIHSLPMIVDGYPRFQYGGFTFMMVDPWPGDWAQDWYASDDVYVGYDNGYYLYDRMHPGEAVAITVVL